jgi:hypothetical protein
MIRVTPKTVTVTGQIAGYTVRGVFQAGPSWSPATLARVLVTFVDARRRPLDRALAPAETAPTPSQLAVIQATPRLPADTAQSWLERASASFVQDAYGLSPAAPPSPAPAPARGPAQ